MSQSYATPQTAKQAVGQNVKSRAPSRTKKLALSSAQKLARTTFRTSREMDFFSAKELVTQTGHAIGEWPLVVLKELIDNALDACEEADVAPVIDVTADASGISVNDNGPGLPETTLAAALDFTIRASNREAYVSPCRGAQGNALKTILPMGRIVDPDHGRLIVTAHGKRHVITCGADPISQRAVVNDDVSEPPKCKKPPFGQTGKSKLYLGTEVRIEWSPREDDCGNVWPFDDMLVDRIRDRFCSLVEGFAVFNPHATIRLTWFGKKTTWRATEPAWSKWKPNKPTSPHWYELSHLERLIGAYITHDRDGGTDRLVSDLLVEFDGLSGSQKRTKVLDDAGLRRVKLSKMVAGSRLDSVRIGKLLAAMQRHTRPVASDRLGIIGEDHLRQRLLAMGVQPASFPYSRKVAKSNNSGSASDEKASFMPWVLESAFGWMGADATATRRIYSGANWSAAIKNPFRSFGATGEGLETALAEMRATRNEPIVFVLHLAHPRVEYTDRGKSAIVIGGAA